MKRLKKIFNTILSYLTKTYKNISKKVINNIMGIDLKKAARNMSFFAIVVALVGIYFWYGKLYMTNERRFWLALENSMSTSSVTRVLNSGGSGNKVVQAQQFLFSPQQAVRSHVSYEQKNATVSTSIETEGLSFVGSDYTRYTSFDTNQKKSDGSVPNLDGIIDKWEKTTYGNDDLENSRLNFISENVSLVIFGNFSPEARRDILNELKQRNVYSIKSSIETEDDTTGRKQLAYNISVDLKSYTAILQKAFYEAGYGEFPPLNPDNYKEGTKLNAGIKVDKKSGAVVAVSFGGMNEEYRGYGINIKAEAPVSEYESGQLQDYVQNEIGGAL